MRTRKTKRHDKSTSDGIGEKRKAVEQGGSRQGNRTNPRRTISGMAAPDLAAKGSRGKSVNRDGGQSTRPVAYLGQCNCVKAHYLPIFAAAVSPDGKWLATAESGRVIKIWSLPLYSLETVIEMKTYGSDCLAFSRNGQWLVSGDGDGILTVFSVKKEWEKQKSISAESWWISTIAITPDSKSIVSCGPEGVKIWSLSTGKLLKSWGGEDWKYANSGLAVSPNGKYLATAGESRNYGKGVELWSLQAGEEGRLITRMGRYEKCKNLAFSPDSKWLAIGYEYAGISVFSIPGASTWRSINHRHPIKAMVFSPDGERVITGGDNNELCIWLFDSKELEKAVKVDIHDTTEATYNTHYCYALSTTPDGKLLISGHKNGSLRIWGLPFGEPKRCLIDLAANKNDVKGVSYRYKSSTGAWVTVTYPDCVCAPPPSPGTTCICDAVAGSSKY